MKVQFIAGIAAITPDPPASRGLYIDSRDLPLDHAPDDDHEHSESIEGSKHFGVWPLSHAAQACFGTETWPDDKTVPQASFGFEMADPAAVEAAGTELESRPHPAAPGSPRTLGPNGCPPAVA
jgi:hypothetical protein